MKADLNQLNDFVDVQITKAKTEGVQGTLLEHWTEIKDAIAGGDYFLVARAINRLLSHVFGDECMHGKAMTASDEMKAIPWAALIPLFLQILQAFFNR